MSSMLSIAPLRFTLDGEFAERHERRPLQVRQHRLHVHLAARRNWLNCPSSSRMRVPSGSMANRVLLARNRRLVGHDHIALDAVEQLHDLPAVVGPHGVVEPTIGTEVGLGRLVTGR